MNAHAPKPTVITDTKIIVIVHDGWIVGSKPYFADGKRTVDMTPLQGPVVSLPIRPLQMTTIDLASGAKVVMQIGCVVIPHPRFNFADMVPCMWGRFCPGGTRLPAPDAPKIVDAGGEHRLN